MILNPRPSALLFLDPAFPRPCFSSRIVTNGNSCYPYAMPRQNDPEQPHESALLLMLFALFLFASPFTIWWASGHNDWFLPYLLWLLIILIGAWLHARYRHHDL